MLLCVEVCGGESRVVVRVRRIVKTCRTKVLGEQLYGMNGCWYSSLVDAPSDYCGVGGAPAHKLRTQFFHICIDRRGHMCHLAELGLITNKLSRRILKQLTARNVSNVCACKMSPE